MNRSQYVAMYNRLKKTRTSYAECVKITRHDGVTFRFTSHDKALGVWENGHHYLYQPAGGFQLTAIENQSGLKVNNLDLEAVVTDDAITEDDLIAGKFDNANVEIFIAYWANTRVGTLPLRTSWIGELRVEGVDFRADLRGIAQRLAQVFVETTSLECRYDFCDVNYTRSYCGLNRADYTDSYTVTSGVGKSELEATSLPDNSNYKWGLLTWTGGNNAGLEMEVIHHTDQRIGLFLPMPNTIEVGDTFDIMEGCDKRYSTCMDRFSNGANFGGEPFLAGSDLLNRHEMFKVNVDDSGKKGGKGKDGGKGLKGKGDGKGGGSGKGGGKG